MDAVMAFSCSSCWSPEHRAPIAEILDRDDLVANNLAVTIGGVHVLESEGSLLRLVFRLNDAISAWIDLRNDNLTDCVKITQTVHALKGVCSTAAMWTVLSRKAQHSYVRLLARLCFEHPSSCEPYFSDLREVS